MLSGDNAMVVGLAVRKLPPARQKIALSIGVLFAMSAQIVATLTVASTLKFPPVALAAGILLCGVAIRLLRNNDREADPGAVTDHSESLYQSIFTVVGAYLLMSLDNVLAIAALGRDYPVILCLGLLVSCVLLVFGGLVIAGLMKRYPLLVTGVAGFLGWRAGMMIGGALVYFASGLDHQAVAILIPAVMTIVVVSSPLWRRTQSPCDSMAGDHASHL